MKTAFNPVFFALLTAYWPASSLADEHHHGGIHATAQPEKAIDTAFDIVHAKVTSNKNIVTFHMAVTENAGATIPSPTGKLGGSSVYSYVWPTSLNSQTVGFDADAGILALAVTAHPDFDDTPLFDENRDNQLDNDGATWHSHWVVLKANDRCGKGALGVVDIPKGATPKLPKTWPGLPILLDSPGWQPVFNEDTVEVKVAFDASTDLSQLRFDGVTAGLRVHQSVHAPLLCVVNVMDIASGDLSLPGKINQ